MLLIVVVVCDRFLTNDHVFLVSTATTTAAAVDLFQFIISKCELPLHHVCELNS